MNELPDLVLHNILGFLDPDICCRNKHDLSILVCNKYLSEFYKRHFSYRFHTFIDLKQHAGSLRMSGKWAPTNLKFCLSPWHCNLLNKEEVSNLDNLMCRYKSIMSPHNSFTEKLYKRDRYSISDTNERWSKLNIHFNSKTKLENFTIKMAQLNSNVWFNRNYCCDGQGCDVEII